MKFDEYKDDHIGKMRHRISIRQYSTSRNAAGEEILSWSELAEVWAEAKYLTGGSDEGEMASRQTAKIACNFRIRYRSDIDEKMTISWNSKIWNIRAILPDNHLKYQLIEAEYFLT